MKTLVFLSCIFLYALSVLAYPTTPQTHFEKRPLLGSKQCTWGPSFWCGNLTNAKSCNAVKHCIQTVWVHQNPPPDTDSVCQICVKMVKEARDQLQSNETQEELKEVFEGSCNLIPLKPISAECRHLVDDFIPELVDTLASQMNPQVVCSVAGLCNNARIDKLLEEAAKKGTTTEMVPTEDKCEGCHTVIGKLEDRFRTMSRDQVLQGMLRICGRMSSFSDGCTNIVLTYFDDMYQHLLNDLSPDAVCLMAGVCSAQFHIHNQEVPNVEVRPMSDAGKLSVTSRDDLPCELCEQLVSHLRDLLVANTTEQEFQRVLQGLCSQTKGFKDECRSLVDQYYPQIYSFLINELNPNSACILIGICNGKNFDDEGPIWALLPPQTAVNSVKILAASQQQPIIGRDESMSYKAKNVEILQQGKEVQVSNPELVQLPIERMLPHSLTLNGNTQLCTFCEYFLHFVQQEITSPKTEEQIKKVIDSVCERLPKTVSHQCESFVEMYGDAFVALLAQEIDPSQVCPLLSLCPAQGVQEVEILMHSKPQDKPNCPLCLFAVTQLEDMIRNKKTEETIRNALNQLCAHLPKNLASECEDFVHTYSNELIEMLVADLTPQEICVYLKLCEDKSLKHKDNPMTLKQDIGDWTLTNEIPDNTKNGKVDIPQKPSVTIVGVSDNSPQCVICEFVMSQIEHELQDKATEEDIKRIVHGVCNHLPKSVGRQCNDFVNKYADMVIQLLISTMEPGEVCSMMKLCSGEALMVTEEILDCAICETTVHALDKLLDNPKVDHKMEHVLKKACLALPSRNQEKCRSMIDAYGDSFFHLVSQLSDSKAVCVKVGLCSDHATVSLTRQPRQTQQPVGSNPCTWGPSHWCASKENAEKCQALDHCRTNVWKGDAPTPQVNN